MFEPTAQCDVELGQQDQRVRQFCTGSLLIKGWQNMTKRQKKILQSDYRKIVSYFRIIMLVVHFLIASNAVAICDNNNINIETENNTATCCYRIAKKVH